MQMAVFYSFHYERDVHRVQLIRNMGTVEGQKLLNAQGWEAVRAKGDEAIRNWIDGSVIGCKQFSCSGDAVRRLIMGCRRMLSVEDRAAIMAGLEAGLSPDAYRPLDWA